MAPDSVTDAVADWLLLGRNIRQHICEEFAFSGRLMERWIRQNLGEDIL